MSPDLNNKDIAVIKHQEYINDGQVIVFKEPSKWKQYNSDNVYDYNVNTAVNVDTANKDTEDSSESSGQAMGFTYFIKNVVAVVGEELTINKEGVHVEGETVFNFKDNNYTCKAAEAGQEFSGVLNNQQVFVMGTNHEASFDSLRVFCNYDSDDMFLNSMEVSQHGEVVKVL